MGLIILHPKVSRVCLYVSCVLLPKGFYEIIPLKGLVVILSQQDLHVLVLVFLCYSVAIEESLPIIPSPTVSYSPELVALRNRCSRPNNDEQKVLSRRFVTSRGQEKRVKCFRGRSFDVIQWARDREQENPHACH